MLYILTNLKLFDINILTLFVCGVFCAQKYFFADIPHMAFYKAQIIKEKER